MSGSTKDQARAIWRLVTGHSPFRFLRLQLLVVTSALLELAVVIGIAPVLQGVMKPHAYTAQPGLSIIGSSVPLQTVLYFYLALVVASIVAGITTIRQLSRYAAERGAEIKNDLYRHYLIVLSQHLTTKGTPYYIKQISNEVSRLVDNVLQPVIQINARVVTGLLIILSLVVTNLQLTGLLFALFGLTYVVMYQQSARVVSTQGLLLSEAMQDTIGLLKDSFSLSKEIRALGAEAAFQGAFTTTNNNAATAYAKLNTIYNTPKFVLEGVIYLATIVALIAFSGHDVSATFALSNIAFFGFAALKLLPIAQVAFSGAAQIRSAMSVVDRIDAEVMSAHHVRSLAHSPVKVTQSIELRDVHFGFTADTQLFSGLNVQMQVGECWGVTGPSGIGKSTLIDLICGFRDPVRGERIVDGRALVSGEIVGASLVGQNPIAFRGTVAQNITLDFSAASTNDATLEELVDGLGLRSIVEELPDHLQTEIGEGVLSLSGGQKQRVAIARAMYARKGLMIFDEHTAALDADAEDQVLQYIRQKSHNSIVLIIAHKASVLRKCDKILYITNGVAEAFERYDDIVGRMAHEL